MTKEINNMNDIIDSRDVIARIEELESDAGDDALLNGEAEELAALKSVADEAAEELAMDYTTVSFDGVDYLIRS